MAFTVTFTIPPGTRRNGIVRDEPSEVQMPLKDATLEEAEDHAARLAARYESNLGLPVTFEVEAGNG